MKYLLLLVGLVSLGVGVFGPHHPILIIGGAGALLFSLGTFALGSRPSKFYEEGDLKEDDPKND